MPSQRATLPIMIFGSAVLFPIRFAVLLMALLVLAIPLVAEDQRSSLVSNSPDGKVSIMVEQPLPVTITQEDGGETRWAGDPDAAPESVQFIDTGSKRLLGAVKGEAGGPVSAQWRKDSRYVILTWRGYRMNWYKCLVHLNPQRKPQLVELTGMDLIGLLQKDNRPVWKREVRAQKGDLDYPFEKKRWWLVPDAWTKTGNLLIRAIELAREQNSHPFEQGVARYLIEVQVSDDTLRPVRVTTGTETGPLEVWKAPKT